MDKLLMKNVCPAGRQAMACFIFSVCLFTISFFSGSVLGHSKDLWLLTLWGPGLYFCLFNFICTLWYKGFTYGVLVRSFFLGATFSTGLYLSTYTNGWRVFGLYIMVLSMFHFSEFMSVALTNPKTLTLDSFILNHSVQYGLAAVASWVEWGLEYYYFPDMKSHFWLSYIGVLICIGGEIFRKTAMFTAKTNFNHTVQFTKRADHELVTHGVYRACRHPSYVGWFYWSIGTQVTLLNPVCVVVYALASWLFFRERVLAEEYTLLAFFGRQYAEYQATVGTGLPCIAGYHPGPGESFDKLEESCHSNDKPETIIGHDDSVLAAPPEVPNLDSALSDTNSEYENVEPEAMVTAADNCSPEELEKNLTDPVKVRHLEAGEAPTGSQQDIN